MMLDVVASGSNPPPIERAVVNAILAGRIQAGTRLGEQALADLFAVSRTTVREALIRLEAHGIVQVVPRRGWFVVEPSTQETHDAFQARLAVELGVLQCAASVPPTLVARLRAHIRREREAIADGNAGMRCSLASEFHVVLAGTLGNTILADLLLHLTARTVPITALYQTSADATVSIDEHDEIVDAIEAVDFTAAGRLMRLHLTHLEAVVPPRPGASRLPDLRHALLPNSRETDQ
jgi:DNA-binding GntR family transcriptional regulator